MSIAEKKMKAITVDPKMQDYEKEPFFIKKMAIASSFVKKNGIASKKVKKSK